MMQEEEKEEEEDIIYYCDLEFSFKNSLSNWRHACNIKCFSLSSAKCVWNICIHAYACVIFSCPSVYLQEATLVLVNGFLYNFVFRTLIKIYEPNWILVQIRQYVIKLCKKV
jgi:hypothetical protein